MYTPYHLYMIFYLEIFITKAIIKYLVKIIKLNNLKKNFYSDFARNP